MVELRELIRTWLPAPPAEVLDVGCGDGALTEWLSGLGYAAVGLDPEPPAGSGFIRARLEELRRPGAFDAAVAVGSLHHLDDPPTAIGQLADALRPGARLVISEFAVEAYDQRAERWLEQQALGPMRGRDEHQHLVPLGELRRLLEGRLRELHFEQTPHLAREYRHPELIDREAASIAAGEIPAIGAQMVYERE